MKNLVGKYIPYDGHSNLTGIFYFYNEEIKQKRYDIYTKTSREYQSVPVEYITYRNITTPFFFCTEAGHPYIIFGFDQPILVTRYSIGNAPSTEESPHSYPMK